MISENERIDWEDLLEGYNRIKKTNYKTVTDMLTNLYAEQKILVRTGKVLGVSSQTVCSKMIQLGIPRLPKGHRGESKCIRAILLLGDVSQMNATEIAKAIDYSRSYVTVCLQKKEVPYRKQRRNNENKQ